MQHPEVKEEEVGMRAPATNASLTSEAAYVEVESSARLLTPPAPAIPARPVHRPPIEMFPAVARPATPQPEQVDEPPIFMSRQWRAEAWEREREREMRSAEHRTDGGLRRRSS